MSDVIDFVHSAMKEEGTTCIWVKKSKDNILYSKMIGDKKVAGGKIEASEGDICNIYNAIANFEDCYPSNNSWFRDSSTRSSLMKYIDAYNNHINFVLESDSYVDEMELKKNVIVDFIHHAMKEQGTTDILVKKIDNYISYSKKVGNDKIDGGRISMTDNSLQDIYNAVASFKDCYQSDTSSFSESSLYSSLSRSVDAYNNHINFVFASDNYNDTSWFKNNTIIDFVRGAMKENGTSCVKFKKAGNYITYNKVIGNNIVKGDRMEVADSSLRYIYNTVTSFEDCYPSDKYLFCKSLTSSSLSRLINAYNKCIDFIFESDSNFDEVWFRNERSSSVTNRPKQRVLDIAK